MSTFGHRAVPPVGLRILAIAVGTLLFAASTKTSADPDLWGHLKFGLDVVQTHTVPSTYPYAFNQDRPWVNHEYGSEVSMALAYLAGGLAGLVLLKGALVFASLCLVWRALRGSDFPVRIGVVGLVVLGTGSITAMMRPQLWTLLFTGILCHSLANERWHVRRWLPLLFAAWANLHGGFVLGLGVLWVFAGVDVLTNREGLLRWTALVTTSTVATLATPYGLMLWRFVQETVGFSRDIEEWQPLWRAPLMNWLPSVAVGVGGIWILRRSHSLRPQVAAVLAVLAYSAVRVSRIGPLFVEAAAILLASPIVSRWPTQQSRLRISPGASVVVSIVGVAVLTGAGTALASTLSCIEVAGTWTPPSNAVRLLRTSAPGRIVTFFDWGEYAIWHLGPRLRVSMDGTRETVYSHARLAEHDAILRGDVEGLHVLENWQPEYIWLPARSVATKQWLTAHGYRLELDDPTSFVAVRADLPVLQKATAELSPSRRCFPN